MPFRRGPEINPFSAAARDGLRRLESVTPIQMAAAVPRIVISKIDFRTGRPIEDVRPLMYDLVQTPQFGSSGGDDFEAQETFKDRALVSLNGITVETKQGSDLDVISDVTLKFTVHRPDIVFTRGSKVAWREILEEGNSFSLEYGWVADPVACPNELFNGHGFVSDSGTAISSVRVCLLQVAKWSVQLKQNGEVDVSVFAVENGDIGLRDARFSDAAGVTVGVVGPPGPDGTPPKISDDDAARGLFNRLKSLAPVTSVGNGKFYTLGDIFDLIVAPLIVDVAKRFEYTGGTPLLGMGNFNVRAGSQSVAWGGRPQKGSIADFMIPVNRLTEEFSTHLSKGRALTLRNFINIVLGFVNTNEAWDRVLEGQQRPLVAILYDTVRTEKGLLLSVTVFDRAAVGDNEKKLRQLPLERQTKEEVLRTLSDAGVPVVEFSRANSVYTDVNFTMQPEPLLQSIQVEQANDIRKSRVQKTAMPDVESRKGMASPQDIVPISILEGEITMYGNFVLGIFDRVWVEFFGSSAISGIFNVISRVDTLEPGMFKTQLKLISEGSDPLNTRFRFTDAELSKRTRKK
jgi:hypothetical protein